MICFRCQRRLPTSSFWKDNKKKSGYRSTCKECLKTKKEKEVDDLTDVCLAFNAEQKQENILQKIMDKFNTFTTVSIEKSGRVIIKPHSPKMKRVITTIDSISSVL